MFDATHSWATLGIHWELPLWGYTPHLKPSFSINFHPKRAEAAQALQEKKFKATNSIATCGFSLWFFRGMNPMPFLRLKYGTASRAAHGFSRHVLNSNDSGSIPPIWPWLGDGINGLSWRPQKTRNGIGQRPWKQPRMRGHWKKQPAEGWDVGAKGKS